MKFIWGIVLILPTLAFGQQGSGVWDSTFQFAMDSADVASGKPIFESAKPDVIVQISKHQYGADMFEITAVKPYYPVELLVEQINKMCDIVGVPARGIRAGQAGIGGDPRLTSTRATFATNGIIDREQGILRIEPIIKAFAGAPRPYTVHGLLVLFNGEQPTTHVLKSYMTPGVRLQGASLENPPAVEYRIQLLSQDPKLLEVPDTGVPPEQNQPQTASTVQQTGFDWLLWISLSAAAIASSILVYFFMLRATTKPRR
jgi:hypothetical protein